ncbi:DoxX family membrane protein [candidate division KSB1 bacterium]|nr:DoxX family membrane protein [candidate division KSB1 bacterium]
MSNFYPLIGRVLLSVIFLISGLNKIFNFGGTQQYMEMHGMPLTTILLIGAILIEIFGALAIIIGYKAKWAARILIIFMIPTTLIFHSNFGDQMQQIQFMKNLAMIGGLIYVALYGSGPLSVEGEKTTA